MASATAGNDTAVGPDVKMTERDQPPEAVLARTASGLKRLHTGEIKQSEQTPNSDTTTSPDQLPQVLAAGAEAAAVPTDPGAVEGEKPMEIAADSAAAAASDGGAADASAPTAQVTNAEEGDKPAPMEVSITEPKTDTPSAAEPSAEGPAAAADAAAKPADAGGAATAEEAAAPTSEALGAKTDAVDVTAPQEGDPAEMSAGADAVAGDAAATGPAAPARAATEGAAPDIASEKEFPPVSGEAKEAGEATAKAETQPEGGETAASVTAA